MTMKKYEKILGILLAVVLVCPMVAFAGEKAPILTEDFATLENWTSMTEANGYTLSETGGVDNSSYLKVSSSKNAGHQIFSGMEEGKLYKLSFNFKADAAEVYPLIIVGHDYRQNGLVEKGKYLWLNCKYTTTLQCKQAIKGYEHITGINTEDYQKAAEEIRPLQATASTDWEYREVIFEIPSYRNTYSDMQYTQCYLYLGSTGVKDVNGSVIPVGYDNIRVEELSSETTLYTADGSTVKTALSGNETVKVGIHFAKGAGTAKALACLYKYVGSTPQLEQILTFSEISSQKTTLSFTNALQTTVNYYPAATAEVVIPALATDSRYMLSVITMEDILNLQPLCGKAVLEKAAQ